MMGRSAGALLLASMVCSTSFAAHRSAAEKHSFQREHPCPSTGQRRGSCPGYVIDHRVALCVGGPDRHDNMQWQTVAAAKRKDRWECRPGWERHLRACESGGGC